MQFRAISQDEDIIVNSWIVFKGHQERQVENICYYIADIAVCLPEHVIAIGGQIKGSAYCAYIADPVLLEALLTLVDLHRHLAMVIPLNKIA